MTVSASPGPFIAAAPDNLRLELIRPGQQPDLATAQAVILVPIRADDSSKKNQQPYVSIPEHQSLLETPTLFAFGHRLHQDLQNALMPH